MWCWRGIQIHIICLSLWWCNVWKWCCFCHCLCLCQADFAITSPSFLIPPELNYALFSLVLFIFAWIHIHHLCIWINFWKWCCFCHFPCHCQWYHCCCCHCLSIFFYCLWNSMIHWEVSFLCCCQWWMWIHIHCIFLRLNFWKRWCCCSCPCCCQWCHWCCCCHFSIFY